MKRLVDFILRRPRNKPGGMAWVRGLGAGGDGSAELNGAAVKTVRRDGAMWFIEPALSFVVQRPTTFLPGIFKFRGDVATVASIRDECLEPWKADGVTDEEVAELYAPNTKEIPYEQHRTKAQDPAGHRARGETDPPV